MMRAMYVQVIVDSLNEKFHDLHVSNASKLVSPKYWISDEKVHIYNYVTSMVKEIDRKIWIDGGWKRCK